ncbi:DUF4865 family protein [Paraburkholderia sp. MMS20-SJTR3]|uniref:DUF4865 family protein n=1 Tax=Paraburkholderia sejongensis TaxID=2886946 RepID=A0ABS8K0B2_9BURK|nr:DUF4865 family protein [Paraburkholderia sp. MMS20-SJTR3]MCC8395579.1 DUF4865 family protein [Paraburkholderia sp. MMS20-SJTR3]
MLIKQYENRLPSDYDMAVIRERGRNRGVLWDKTEGLAFKAFALRERGRHGAQHNAYTSIYLWLEEGAVAQFVTGPRFKPVLESFGRPPIQTWLPIDVRVGHSGAALSIYREDLPVPERTDLVSLRVSETARNAEVAAHADTIAAVVGLDVQNWRLARFILSSQPLHEVEQGVGYEIAHLAAPGLVRLSRVAADEAALVTRGMV